MTSVCTFSLDKAQTLEFKHEKIKDENRQEYIAMRSRANYYIALLLIFIIKLIKDENGINGTLHTLIDKKCFFSNSRYNQVEDNYMKKQLKEEYILKLYAKWTEAQTGRSKLKSYIWI